MKIITALIIIALIVTASCPHTVYRDRMDTLLIERSERF